ncbi:UNVERIFIED_CONTAM: hypothetical protein GTU68_036134 [Idotea baltica]|nr:hypothetical protein [Idotea baltica]
MLLDFPKQYLKINDKTVIEHTLDIFFNHDQVAGVVVVLHPSDPYWRDLNISSINKPLYTVNGGENRSDSVIQGLKCLQEEVGIKNNSWVMVHDSVRPCLLQTDIDSLLELRVDESVGGILASPVRDTMKRVNANLKHNKKKVLATEPRENLWHAMTPQMFRLGDLSNALLHCREKNVNITDESSAMENMNYQPELVEGSHNNIKITHPSDIALAKFFLSEKKTDRKV